MIWRPKDKKKWHKWFAWYPVSLENGDRVWLETIQRRERHGWDVYHEFRLPRLDHNV